MALGDKNTHFSRKKIASIQKRRKREIVYRPEYFDDALNLGP